MRRTALRPSAPGPLVLAALLSLAAPAARGEAEASLAEAERRRLEAGEVLFELLEPAGGAGVAVRAKGLVEATPQQVWPALRDCERYQEFLPGVSSSELRSRRDDVAVCYTEIDLPWPIPDLVSEMRVRERRLESGGFRRDWTLIEGSYDRNQGSWQLLPWSGGARTLAIYEVDLQPRTVIPDFLLRRAQRRTVPEVFGALRERVAGAGGA